MFRRGLTSAGFDERPLDDAEVSPEHTGAPAESVSLDDTLEEEEDDVPW